MKTKLHCYWYLNDFTDMKHGEIDVTYENGVYHAETPEFPCDIPDGDEGYRLHEENLNCAFGDKSSFYFFTKDTNSKAAYMALERHFQSMLSDAKASVIILENQCEKIRKLSSASDAIIKAMVSGMFRQ